MVADLLQTSVEYAPILEAVLAGESQSIVYHRTVAIEERIASEASSWQGRVTFLPQENTPTPAQPLAAEFLLRSDLPGVIGPLDHFVETAPRIVPWHSGCWRTHGLSRICRQR